MIKVLFTGFASCTALSALSFILCNVFGWVAAIVQAVAGLEHISNAVLNWTLGVGILSLFSLLFSGAMCLAIEEFCE